MKSIMARLGKGALVISALLAAHQANAAGTTAGSTVNNTATITYKIDNVTQDPVPAAVSFVVDRKIDVVVAESNTQDVQVVPGATNQVATFTVTNASNAQLDFALAVTNIATGPRGQTDTFDPTGVEIYIDDGDGVLDAGDGSPITHINGLLPTDPGVVGQGTVTVHVVVDIPSSPTVDDGDIAAIALTATARENDNGTLVGAAITATAGADTAGMDTVFADGDSSGVGGDTASNGAHSDSDAYVVSVTALTVAKSVRIISNVINGVTNTATPKAIPTATLEYCILMTNTGATDATDVDIADALPAQVTYVANSLKSGPACLTANTVEDDDSSDSGEGDGVIADFTSGTVNGLVSTITGGGGTRALRFQVTVN